MINDITYKLRDNDTRAHIEIQTGEDRFIHYSLVIPEEVDAVEFVKNEIERLKK